MVKKRKRVPKLAWAHSSLTFTQRFSEAKVPAGALVGLVAHPGQRAKLEEDVRVLPVKRRALFSELVPRFSAGFVMHDELWDLHLFERLPGELLFSPERPLPSKIATYDSGDRQVFAHEIHEINTAIDAHSHIRPALDWLKKTGQWQVLDEREVDHEDRWQLTLFLKGGHSADISIDRQQNFISFALTHWTPRRSVQLGAALLLHVPRQNNLFAYGASSS